MTELRPIPDWVRSLSSNSPSSISFACDNRKTPRTCEPRTLPRVSLSLRQWVGPLGSWGDSFGKYSQTVCPLDNALPSRSCAEIEVAKILRGVRDQAYWVSSYPPKRIPPAWRPWVLSVAELPEWLRSVDVTIRKAINRSKGGIADVVAWNVEDPLRSAVFVECKGEQESIREGQEDWVSAAVHAGLSQSQFAVAICPKFK